MPADPGPYEFIQMQPVGEGPIAWDPCRPIRYVVNPSGAPAGSDQLLTEAIANTSAATGLQFTHEGVTAETWTKERDAYSAEGHDSEWAPVLISWSTEETTPDLAGYIAGFAGGVSVRDGDGPATFVSGYVVLDSADATNLLTTPNGSQALRAVIQHELGHLVGLGHVADATQLMYTETSASQTGTWGSGDLAGLHVLGTQPCLPELEAQ